MQVFYLPATRHPWYWLGIRSIDRDTFHSLLAAQNSVVLVPGGVSECMLMKKGKPALISCQRQACKSNNAVLLRCPFGQASKDDIAAL